MNLFNVDLSLHTRREAKMVKINLDSYNLICTRNEDGRKFLYKYVTKMDVRCIDSETGEILSLTQAKFRSRFTPDSKSNKRNKKRPFFMNYGRERVA